MQEDILGNLRRAVIEYDATGAANWAMKAIEEKINPLAALDVIADAVNEVGEAFGRGDLWLPDLVGAAAALQAASPFLEKEIAKTGTLREYRGTVIIGTAFGDVHDIGKNMVSTLLIANGFKVIDLGVNVGCDQFMEAIINHKAEILAMSSLLTTTAPEQRKVINVLQERGLRNSVKIMVGGGAITKDFANQIGADGYASTAVTAVELACKLVV